MFWGFTPSLTLGFDILPGIELSSTIRMDNMKTIIRGAILALVRGKVCLYPCLVKMACCFKISAPKDGAPAPIFSQPLDFFKFHPIMYLCF
jgi:hypothetical protein